MKIRFDRLSRESISLLLQGESQSRSKNKASPPQNYPLVVESPLITLRVGGSFQRLINPKARQKWYCV